ncbi:LamG-like jellyroll fold domain-containing protein, partial [Paenibacillus sp. MCAF20]
MKERRIGKPASKLGKKLLSFFLSVTVITGAFSAAAGDFANAADTPTIPENGLIADYSFTEAPLDGKTVPNKATGEGAVGDAVVQNETTAAWEDNALKFSGAGTSVSNPAGTWVSLPNQILSGKTSATITIEVKPSAAIITKNHFLWNIGNKGTATYWFSNTLAPRTSIKYGGTEKTASSPAQLAADRWYSITSVINADAKSIAYYVDGVKVGEALDSGLSLAQITDQSFNTIGRAPFNDPMFEGSVSSFRVYDRALSDSEVKAISDADVQLHDGYFDQLLQDSLAGVSDIVIDKPQTKLPSNGGTVTWVSNIPVVTIAEDGITASVIQPASDSPPLTGTLTASVTIRGQAGIKEVNVTVLPKEAITSIPKRGLIADYSFVGQPADGKTVNNQATGTGAAGAAIVQNETTAAWENNGLVFSGEGTSVSSPTGTWVSLPNNLLGSKSSATISIEVKPSAANNGRFHFLWSIGNSGTSNYWFANLLDPRTSIKYGGSEKTALAPSKLAGDRWYNVTSVIDAELKTIFYYIDGVKVGELEDSAMSLSQIADQTRNTIGLAPYNDPLFQGAVSTFRVYDRALSAEEITFISNADAQLHAGPAEPTALAVSEVTVSASGSAAVSLHWNVVADASYYNVYRSIAGQDTYVKLQKVAGTSFKDETVTLSTDYEYRITAVSGREVESVPSTSVTAEVQVPTEPPAAPTELAVTGFITRTSVDLKWTASAGSSEYVIYRSNTASGGA